MIGLKEGKDPSNGSLILNTRVSVKLITLNKRQNWFKWKFQANQSPELIQNPNHLIVILMLSCCPNMSRFNKDSKPHDPILFSWYDMDLQRKWKDIITYRRNNNFLFFIIRHLKTFLRMNVAKNKNYKIWTPKRNELLDISAFRTFNKSDRLKYFFIIFLQIIFNKHFAANSRLQGFVDLATGHRFKLLKCL